MEAVRSLTLTCTWNRFIDFLSRLRRALRRLRLPRRWAAFGRTLGAAVIGQIAHQRRHGGEIRRVDELAALATLGDESRALQILKREGQGGGNEPPSLGDPASG